MTADVSVDPYGVLLTREVRWFVLGSLPADVDAWFRDLESEVVVEHRVDSYEADFARRGIGLKRRGEDTIDVKLLAGRREAIEIAPGLVGNVEDWLKLSESSERGEDRLEGPGIEVVKHLQERRYLIGGSSDGGSGCKVELGAVEVGANAAWTLCLETFGGPGELDECLAAGVKGLSTGPSLPLPYRLTPDLSFGYPAFLSSIDAG